MKKSKQITLPERFVPMFWDDADGRCAMVKKITNRYADLKADCQADSVQKNILCQRATFIAIQLETQEVQAVETGDFDSGRYTQMVNCLVGLLRSLGLERRAKQVCNLADYVEQKKVI